MSQGQLLFDFELIFEIECESLVNFSANAAATSQELNAFVSLLHQTNIFAIVKKEVMVDKWTDTQ